MEQCEKGYALKKMIEREQKQCLAKLKGKKTYVENKTIWMKRTSQDSFDWGYLGSKEKNHFILFSI